MQNTHNTDSVSSSPPMSERPPRQLVDWWMEKTAEERQAFLEDSSASSTGTMPQNLAAVEAYCAANSYRVFLESQIPLSQRQLGCHVFPAKDEPMGPLDDDGEENQEEVSKPEAPTGTRHTDDRNGMVVVLESGATLSLGTRALLAPFSPVSGIGERARGSITVDTAADERRTEAAAVVARAHDRLSRFFMETGVIGDGATVKTVTDFLIRLLQEAATAAACRLGITERVEKTAQEAYRRRMQRERRVLVLSTAEPGAAAATSTATADAAASTVRTVTRPVGDRASALHGFLGVCLLARPLLAGADATRKRSRKPSRAPPPPPSSTRPQNASRAWSELRNVLSDVPLPGGGTVSANRAMGRRAPAVIITEQDVLFALHHMKQDEGRATRHQVVRDNSSDCQAGFVSAPRPCTAHHHHLMPRHSSPLPPRSPNLAASSESSLWGVADMQASKPIDVLCTMATKECRQELLLFVRSLRVFHPALPLVIGCSRSLLTSLSPASPSSSQPTSWETDLLSDARIRWIPCLDQYGTINRREMEQQRGVWFPSRHSDFMMEKANLLEYALGVTAPSARPKTDHTVAAFVDCDVCFLAPLPTIPKQARLALSPHAIEPAHEALFGRYNGGYVVVEQPQMLVDWRVATHSSRFFDQASLEALAEKYSRDGMCHLLPPQHNYGYWRLLQTAEKDIETEAAKFSIGQPDDGNVENAPSILYDGVPLASVHTHFFLPRTQARDITLFNTLITKWVKECVHQGNERYRNAVSPLFSCP